MVDSLQYAVRQETAKEEPMPEDKYLQAFTEMEKSILEKAKDKEVRLIISKELGHERESITATYLGR